MDENQTNGNDPLNERDTMLLGDMRDKVLDACKKVLVWDHLAEEQQLKFNVTIEQVAREVIREITRTAAGRDFPFVEVSVSSLHQKDKGILEAKLFADDTDFNATLLLRAGRCLVVKADPEKFMGAKPAPVMKDQPDLPDIVDGLQDDGTVIDGETGEIIPPAPEGAKGRRGRPPKRFPPRLGPPEARAE